MSTGNEITVSFKKSFLSPEVMMRNKNVNYLLIFIGVALFVSFICLRSDPRICNSIHTFTIVAVVAIIGAMLVLFGVINLTAIFNRKEDEENNSIEN